MYLIIFAITFVISLAIRFIWIYNGNPYIAELAFWGCSLISIIAARQAFPKRYWPYCMFVGVACNAIAMLTNNGYMPALTTDQTVVMWAPVTAGTRFYYLCDILPYGSSIGDVCLLAGLILFFVQKVNQPNNYQQNQLCKSDTSVK